MARKERVDGTAEAVRIMQGAGKQIQPPSNVPLSSRDMPFFASVIDEFARADWTAHQLELAAMLARKMAVLEREQRTIEAEGYVVETANGTPMANPRLQGIRAMDASILSTRRSLSLHARARGEARDVGKRAAIAKGTEADLGDELLARPS
jgi:hypothetical protein